MKKKILSIAAILVLIPVVVFFGFPEVILKLSVNSKRKSAGLVKKSVDAAGHTIVYLDGGTGQAVVLLHGLGGDKDNWTDFAKSVTPKYRVIAVDLPGCGESSKNAADVYGIGAQVERLDAFLKAVNVNRCHLVGNGMGGVIAGKYTVKHPDRVLSLAFFSTEGINSPEASEYSKLMSRGKNILSPETIQEFDEMLKFLFITPPSIPGPVKKYLFKKSVEARDFNTKIFWDVYGEDYSLEPDLGKIKVKTLVLWGDRDNRMHVSSTKVLAKGLPNEKVVILKGCGHFPMRQMPDATAKVYRAFLGAGKK